MAMTKAQVEILKEKIRQKWGAEFEKVADLILESKEAEWNEMMASSKSKHEFKEKFGALFMGDKK